MSIDERRFRHSDQSVEAQDVDEIADRVDAIANSLPQKRQVRRTVGRDRLAWRVAAGGLSLHYGQRQRVLLRVVADVNWPRMFRIHFADGEISDLANLSRIKDAASVVALRELNSEAEATALGSPPVRQMVRG